MHIIKKYSNDFSRTIWNKSSTSKFYRDWKQIRRAHRASAIWSLKNLRVLIYSKLQDKNHLTIFLIIYMQFNKHRRIIHDVNKTDKRTFNILFYLTNNSRTSNTPIWLTIDGSKPTNDQQTLHGPFSQSRLVTPATDKHHLLDTEDDFCSGCQNVSHQQQFFSELPSHGRSTIIQQELSYTSGETILFFFFARYVRNQETSWINIILTVQSPESAATSRGFEFTRKLLLHALRAYL